MSHIDSALNPQLAAAGAVRSVERPLSPREQMQRANAQCAAHPTASAPSCSGNLFVGMFFDGTGNNEEADFKKHQHDPRHQQHSNVVRLYHACRHLARRCAARRVACVNMHRREKHK